MITEESVMNALKTVMDPEIGIDIVNMGFVYDVKIDGDDVKVAITLTAQGCPLHDTIKQDAERAVLQHTGAASATVNVVFSPPWNPNMMSDEAKKRLGFSPDMME